MSDHYKSVIFHHNRPPDLSVLLLVAIGIWF